MTVALADGRAAALVFLRSLDDACAERLVPTAGGHAVLDARHPLLWDANHLRVETATALVAYAAREARAAGAEHVSLRTDASGSAQQLYGRLGFAGAGLLPRSFHRR